MPQPPLPGSQYLLSAVEATKKGIDSFVLAGMSEQRQSAVLEFGRAVEYLMLCALSRKGDDDPGKQRNSNDLRIAVNNVYGVRLDAKLLRDLRHARNNAEHEAQIIETDALFKLVTHGLLPFLENFYEDMLGEDLDILFPEPYLTILRQHRLSLERETDILLSAAQWYILRDPEQCVKLAQKALGLALQAWGYAIGYDYWGQGMITYIEHWNDYIASVPAALSSEHCDAFQGLWFLDETGEQRYIDAHFFAPFQEYAPQALPLYLDHVRRAIKEAIYNIGFAKLPRDWTLEQQINGRWPTIMRKIDDLAPATAQFLRRAASDEELVFRVEQGTLWIGKEFHIDPLFSAYLDDLLKNPVKAKLSPYKEVQGFHSPPPSAEEEKRRAQLRARLEEVLDRPAVVKAIQEVVPDFPAKMFVAVYFPLEEKYFE
jgi:hypothetical protein